MNTIAKIIIPSLFGFALFSCCPFTATIPLGFASYRGMHVKRSVSSNGVFFRVRHIPNKPYAEFDFWREALPKRMRDAGYRIVKDTVLTVDTRKSLLLEMITPLGAYDYTYMVMMSVKKNKILIAEAAGTVDEFRKQREVISASLQKSALK